MRIPGPFKAPRFTDQQQMKSDTLVIVNPSSGGGRALRAEPEVREPACIARILRANLCIRKARRIFVNWRRGGCRRISLPWWRWAVMARFIISSKACAERSGGGLFPSRERKRHCPRARHSDAIQSTRRMFSCVRGRAAVDLVRVRFNDGGLAHYVGAGGMGLDAEAAHLANTRFQRLAGSDALFGGRVHDFFMSRCWS